MIFPYETKHYCNTADGERFLISTLWVDILDTIGSIEKYEDINYLPNLENIMEGIGCYDSEAILEFLEDLVNNGFLTVSDDCWYLTVKGSEFSPLI